MLTTWRRLFVFLFIKLGLMYLMRMWIRQNLKDMEKRGVVIPHVPE